MKCEYELENMLSESKLKEDVFKLDPNENKLLKIFRNGDGPYTYGFSTKVAFNKNSIKNDINNIKDIKQYIINNIKS